MRVAIPWSVLIVFGVALAGCSGDSDDPKDEQVAGCLERCKVIAASCSLDVAQCPNMCDQVTEKELSCMESTGCNSAQYEACINPGNAEDIKQQQPDTVSGDDVTQAEEGRAGGCAEDCGFDHCDEDLAECVSCVENGHCSSAYNGPLCLFQGTIDATCGCETAGDCAGHPSGEICHDQKACSCTNDSDCALSNQGTKCVSVLPAVGLSQCGCEDADMDCPFGLSCLSNKCM